MAREIREFDITITAGTTKAAPSIQAITFPARVVEAIEWRVPPGPNGTMGFAIAAANMAIIPYNTGAFIVTDNEAQSWPINGYIDSGSWQLIGYNTGTYDHTVYLRFLLNLVEAGKAAGAVLLDPSAISSQ